MRVRHRHRLRKILGWGLLVFLTSLGGGLWFAYSYLTDSDNLAHLLKAELPKYLPGSMIDMGRPRIGLFKGEIHLNHLVVNQVIDGSTFQAVKIPWLSIHHNARALLRGEFEPSEVVVAQPTLRLRRRKDGTWNLQGLLANPWPGPQMKTPPVQILNGTMELCDGKTGDAGVAILRDVAVRVEESGTKGVLKFEGTAKGDTFDRLAILGTVDIKTGRVQFAGDLARLALSDPLRSRLPVELKPAVEQLGLTAGEIDLRVGGLTFDPAAQPRIHYDVSGHLRGGVWSCPKLPFPLNDMSGAFAARDGLFTVDQVDGYYGTTSVRVEHGRVSLLDPMHGPLDLDMEVVDLELDQRLRDRTPPKFAEIWTAFKPSGRISLAVQAHREGSGKPLGFKVVTDCHDVAMLYEHFKYPLEHVRGRLIWEGDRVRIEGMQTLFGGLSANGTIDHPGLNAIVKLNFQGRELPIDMTLLEALPPDVRKVVDEFRPRGTVRGTATLNRLPPEKPGDDPRGRVSFDAVLDLNERCGIVWKGLPYPVNNLTGRLKIHPDLWEFENMRGGNGQAEITGSGRVEKLGGTAAKPTLRVDLRLNAVKLPFDDQLRSALPPAWTKTWAILDPTGSSDVNATIKVEPGKPDSYVLEILPRPATSVTLKYSREPKPGVDPGGTFELPMDHVTGRFVFNNGPVDMQDVGFRFYGANVKFARGRVVVEDSGRFDLGVKEMWAKDIRLDSRLRQIMPPVMAQFAQRLDDGRTFTLKGNMKLGWSGRFGEPVRCGWDGALVVFNDNTVEIQPGLRLEHMQGQFDHVRGWSDGETFDVHGALNLASVSMLGQQITRLESPVDVDHNEARLGDIRGNLLGGRVEGKLGLTLTTTPRYSASIAVHKADLQQYAKTLPGRQTYRGLVDARLELAGFGGDPRTVQGSGEAHVVNGDLGELPVFLRVVKILNLSPATKTAFDSADVVLSIVNGRTMFDPIRFTGNAFSLHGKGTMDVQRDLDLRLRVLFGRDRMHLRVVSDALREASGQFFVVRVQGTPAFPKISLEALPEASDVLKSISQRRGERERD